MDRRELLFAAAVVLAALLLSGGLAHAVPLPFEEGFEDIDHGIYPLATGWNPLSPGKSAYVTQYGPPFSGKSFRLDSLPWSPRMDYVELDELPERLSYEASVCLDAASGWEALVGFMDRCNGTYPMWNFFCVNWSLTDGGRGSITFCGEEAVDLGSYARGKWCTLRADLNYTSLTASLWVDGVLVADGVEITPREFYYAPMGDVVTNQWGVASDASFSFSNVVYFDELYVWEPSTLVSVDIDVKPGSTTNRINLQSQGLLPVCVFSSETFDATLVDPFSCDLAGAPIAIRGNGKGVMAHLEDIDGDGLVDMMLQFEIQQLDPEQLLDGWAVLTGTTLSSGMICATSQGEEFVGMDQVAVSARGHTGVGRARR